MCWLIILPSPEERKLHSVSGTKHTPGSRSPASVPSWALYTRRSSFNNSSEAWIFYRVGTWCNPKSKCFLEDYCLCFFQGSELVGRFDKQHTNKTNTVSRGSLLCLYLQRDTLTFKNKTEWVVVHIMANPPKIILAKSKCISPTQASHYPTPRIRRDRYS